MRKIILVALIALITAVLSAHSFHASLAEVARNPKEKTIEVSLRLFPDDIELAMSKDAGRAVHLDDSPESDKALFHYLERNFVFTSAKSKKQLPLKWVGKEFDVKTLWVYVELPAGASAEEIILDDRILFELYADQVNTVNVKRSADDVRTVTFLPAAPQKSLGVF